MLAFSYKEYGTPDVIEQVTLPQPIPKPNEVLIRIIATTVSADDWRARSLTMPKGLSLMGRLVFGLRGPRKPILGTEFSGVIAAVGAKVTRYQTGDAAIGFPGAAFGAHAEFITMPADGKLTLKPDNIGFEHAAVIPFGSTTAYALLVNKAKLQAGESVLINGASGSVGSACVQIAKHLDAHVTAICSGGNVEMVRGLGADHVIDYRTQDVIETGTQYNMVVDTVGTLPWAQAKHAIQEGGKMVLIAGKTSDMLLGGLKARLAGKTMVGGVASEHRDILEAVVKLAERGVLQPVIDRSYAFDDMKAAHAHVDTGRKKGNVVVRVAEQPAVSNVA